jgi:DNA-binding transcriptional LysR family regulator
MDRYRQMQVFDAVAQAGSLALAARNLNITPVTVSRTVAALEARLNTVLLVRSSRGSLLSPTGEQFASHCQSILQGVEQAQCSVAGLHAHAAGRLTVAVPALLAHPWFMSVALEYLAAFPEVQLVMLARESLPNLLEEGIDVALVVGPLADSSGFAIPLGMARQVLCAAPHCLVAQGRAPHKPMVSCTTRQATIAAAVCGLVQVRCLSVEVHQHLQNGQLQALPGPPMPALPMHLVYREGRKATARVRTFIDFAVPRLRNHPALTG